MRKQLVLTVKWLWVAAVLVAAAMIIGRSWGDIEAMLRTLGWSWIASSLMLTAAAKLFLGVNAHVAAHRTGIDIGFVDAFRLYNLSQLGKYLPGSVWQFVGRAAAYRHLGAHYGPIRDALVCESLWVVAGASVAGAVLTGPRVLGILSGSLPPFVVWWLCVGFASALLALVAAAVWKRALLVRYARLAWPPGRAVVAQAGIWLLLGMGFWVLARGSGLEVEPVFAIGLFAAGYAVGFLVPIAPAGLGVRDAVLTLGLMPYVPAGEALAVTVMARIVYLVVDLVLALGQDGVFALLGVRPMRSA